MKKQTTLTLDNNTMKIYYTDHPYNIVTEIEEVWIPYLDAPQSWFKRLSSLEPDLRKLDLLSLLMFEYDTPFNDKAAIFKFWLIKIKENKHYRNEKYNVHYSKICKSKYTMCTMFI